MQPAGVTPGVVALVFATLVAGGCGENEPPRASARPAASADPRAPTENPAAEGQPSGAGDDRAEAKAGASDGPTGIAACDAYLRKYEACLTASVPEDAREVMREAFAKQKRAWVKTAEAAGADEEVANQLARGCRDALSAAQVPMQQYGCEW